MLCFHLKKYVPTKKSNRWTIHWCWRAAFSGYTFISTRVHHSNLSFHCRWLQRSSIKLDKEYDQIIFPCPKFYDWSCQNIDHDCSRQSFKIQKRNFGSNSGCADQVVCSRKMECHLTFYSLSTLTHQACPQACRFFVGSSCVPFSFSSSTIGIPVGGHQTFSPTRKFDQKVCQKPWLSNTSSNGAHISFCLCTTRDPVKVHQTFPPPCKLGQQFCLQDCWLHVSSNSGLMSFSLCTSMNPMM